MKAGKVFLVAIAGIIVAASIGAYFDDTPRMVKAAEDRVWLDYHEKVYPTPHCSSIQPKKPDGEWYIQCKGSKDAMGGGVFWVIFDDNKYVLWPLNGKGKMHAEKIGGNYFAPYRSAPRQPPMEMLDTALQAFKED